VAITDVDRSVEATCERCGAHLAGGSEQLAGMCLKCLNYVNPVSCQGSAP
jgi:hypothetical protein